MNNQYLYMNNKYLKKWAFLSSVAALAFVPLEGSLGQVSSAPNTAGASADNQLEEVVVTARRREEVIQRTPIAIDAFSTKDIKYQSVNNIIDVRSQVPSLQIWNPGSVGKMGIELGMRGQSESTTNPTDDASVGLYVDDVYQGGRLTATLLPLIDLDRIEVLKGPQGTLYGRNTTAGAVKFITKLPTYDYSGELTVGTGNYDRAHVDAVLNVPIVQDKVALRVVGQLDQHSGYAYDTTNKVDLDDQQQYGVRAALRFDPQDDLDIIARGNWGRGRDHGSFPVSAYLAPGLNSESETIEAITGLLPLNGPPGTPSLFGLLAGDPATKAASVAAATALLPKVNALYNGQANSRNAPLAPGYLQSDRADDAAGSLTIKYDLNDSLTLKSISSFERSASRPTAQTGGTPWVILYFNEQPTDDTLTQEVQAQGRALDDKLNYAIGAYYYHFSGVDQRLQHNFPVTLEPLGFTQALNQSHFNETASSPAAYAQATYAFTPTVNVTAGVRWTEESKHGIERNINTSNKGVLTCASPLPATAATPLDQCFATAQQGDRNISYTFGVDWSVTDDIFLYAKTSRGFKSGGLNDLAGAGAPIRPYAPEIATDYEGGIKSQWLDNRLRVNWDIYHTDYDNIQRSITTIVNGAIFTPTQNAAAATIDGSEFEMSVAPVTGLRLGAAAGYTHFKYLHYTQVTDNLAVYPTGIQDLSGEKPRQISPWTVSTTAGYDYPTGIGNLHTEVDWYWHSKSDLYDADSLPGTSAHAGIAFTPDSYREQKAYGIVNASMSLDIDDYDATITLWGKNITNLTYAVGGLGLVNAGLGVFYKSYGDPATFGVDLTKRFGGGETAPVESATYAPPAPTPVAPVAVPKSYLVFFDFDKSDLTSQALTIVDQAAANAAPAKVTRIEVTGHTDTVGSDAFNMRLSRRRAESVAAELEAKGIRSSEIAIFAKGKRDLLVPTADGIKEPQNRRVQIIYSAGETS